MHIFILYLIVLIIALLNLRCELLRDLMMLQQNSYRSERYLRWLKASGDSTSLWRLLGIISFFICLFPMATHNASMFIVALFCVCSVIFLIRKRKTYKLPLKTTARVVRLMCALAFISAVIVFLTLVCTRNDMPDDPVNNVYVATVTVMGLYCGSHILILVSNFVLRPIEKAINKKYYNEASKILKDMPRLKVIGVTGSYGKTTTKHYINRILSEKYETLMTPGSFNTTLGVVRTIREYLKPFHQFFICEMGAKQTGDIEEICELVHPDCGVITAVGPQHLETFKTVDNVLKTKFELANSIPSDGFVLVNNDSEPIYSHKVSNCECIRYAVKNIGNADFYAENISVSPKGTSFTAVRKKDSHKIDLTTQLVGECNILNLLAAVAIAMRFDVPDEKIQRAVSKIEQVEHRLSIKHVPGGLTIIDDAFNSNPEGSSMALDVLSHMTGQRILITPGMIELGDKQFELNEIFGRKSAECADIIIIVGIYNREAIVSGLEKGGKTSNIHTAETFAEAQILMKSLASPGDTVLYENDLPDTFK